MSIEDQLQKMLHSEPQDLTNDTLAAWKRVGPYNIKTLEDREHAQPIKDIAVTKWEQYGHH